MCGNRKPEHRTLGSAVGNMAADIDVEAVRGVDADGKKKDEHHETLSSKLVPVLNTLMSLTF